MGKDLLFAIRTLIRTPLFTAVAVLSLALGIGANTAIFSLLHQVLQRLLPVREPERVVVLHFEGVAEGGASSDNSESVFSYPMYRDFRDRNQVFDGVVARSGTPVNVTFNEQAEQARAEIVSGNFFEVLGVRPAMGRLLSSGDDVTPGGHPATVLSHGYWTRRFGENTGILNQTIRVNGLPMTVVGVAPRSFRGVVSGQTPDIYLPTAMKEQATPGEDNLERRTSRWLNIFGRLKAGIDPRRAEAALAPLYRTILEEELAQRASASPRFRERYVKNRLEVRSAGQGINQLRGRWGKPLAIVMAMVGLVLLIACANVANLLISRATGRRREIAIRLAVGASRAMLVRQLLVESVLLSLGGGLLGLVFAAWIAQGLIGLASSNALGGWLSAEMDARLFVFTFGLSVVTGLLFGLVPALSATRPELATALRDQGATVSKGQVHFRRGLVAAQVALSLVLLIAAGLFVRSFVNLLQLNPGFRAERLLVFSINPSLSGYRAADGNVLFERLRERMLALPGVVSAGASSVAPLSNSNMSGNITVEGYKPAEDADAMSQFNAVSPGYFATLGVPLVAGREFTAADRAGSHKVAIVNETFAKHFFGDRNPVGRRMTPGAGNVTPDIEIVAVVRDSKHSSLRERTDRFYYRPYLQESENRRAAFFVRTQRDDDGLASEVRGMVREIAPNIPVVDLKWMRTQVEESVYLERLVASLAVSFGLLATLLAVVGLYGVIAYMVARRTVEIGIRVALGASRRSILWLVMREVGALAFAGLAIGIPCALAAGRLIESQLFGIRAGDPAVISASAAVLTCAALLAGYLPARRALAIDPLRALRYE